jgi:cellulose biosynthesis protein BcsQ/tetratricopeptide (TPR) repeat protein
MNANPSTSRAARTRPEIITFYSYKGGTGRTMAVANLAWIMASNGLRVLAVDWDLESPGLHRYFHPFLRDKQLLSTPGVTELVRDYAAATMRSVNDSGTDVITKHAKVLRYAVSLDWPFPHDGTVDFLAAGRQDRSYSRTVSTFDWANFFDRQGGIAFLRALRRDMLNHYDYVLIDSRTGLSDAAGICTVVLPDAVVDCFTMSTQSIEGAAAVARSIKNQRLDEPVRILPVPMRVEDGEQGKLEAGRDYARRLFEPFVADQAPDRVNRYWGDVEIPYRPFYAYEEILACFGDPPHQHNSLLAAFERLTSVITRDRVAETAAIPEPDRRMWLTEFERVRSPLNADVLVSYASVDRMWAEWVSGELDDAGLKVHLQAVDYTPGAVGAVEIERDLGKANRVVVLLSNDYTKAPHAQDVWNLATQQNARGVPQAMVPIRLDTVRLPMPFMDRPAIELAVLSEDRARFALREAFNLPSSLSSGSRGGDEARRPRFPSTPPPVWKVPPRNATFTGRGLALEALRDRLATTPTVVVPQALFGLGGVGKTQVALEYAHRFAADYDVVWWISAEQPSTARSDLFELASALGVARENTADTVRSVLEALRQGRPWQRWLLVYDNADAPDELRSLLPQGAGHVLLTSRNQLWASQAKAVEVGVFDRVESVTFLRQQVSGLTDKDANVLAESLGDLPLVLEQAAAWLVATGMEVGRYVELLETEPTELLDQGRPTGYPRTATATWQVSLRRLREQMPAAAKALEVCAFFAPEPIPLSLLSNERFRAILTPYDENLRLPIMQGRLTREIGRFALARIDFGRNSILIHRLVQAIIRGQLSPEDAAEAKQQAYDVLAAANPVATDDPATWPAFADLWPHLRIPGLLSSRSDDVRQLIIDMVRYRYRRYDFASSAELAEAALAQWVPLFGEDDVLTLHLRFHLANALRSQARYQESLKLNQEVLERLRVVVGPDHPYTLMAAGGLAADRRALGDFVEARDLDVDTAARFRDAFGEDEYRSLMAANNLAVSYRMVGEYQAAADIDWDTYTRRRNILGERHPYTLFSACNWGSDLREIGEFNRSRTVLETTLASYREVIGEDQTDTMRTARNLVVTLRRLGEFTQAHELGVDTLLRYERVLGSEHPDTLVCEMTVASTYAGVGDNTKAREVAESTLDRMRRVLNHEHVLTQVCLHNSTIYMLKTGDAADALPLAMSVRERFRDTLGGDHPYTLNAALNVANEHWALGHRTAARELDEDTYQRFRKALGDHHPDTLNAAINLVVSRDGADPQFETLVADMIKAFAESHPHAGAVGKGERINSYIEPPSP